MRYSARFKFAALSGSLLLASLGWKAAVLASADPVVDDVRLLQALAAKLNESGFSAKIDPRNFLTAEKGACRIKARDYPPTGALERVFADSGAKFGSTRYAFRDEWYSSPPTHLTILHFYAQRELSRAGFDVPSQAIIAVSATPACWSKPPKWAKVARWLR